MAAADDPGAVMEAGTEALAVVAALTRLGDRVAARAAVAVSNAGLCLCVSSPASARTADDKARFLSLMVG